MRWFPALVSNHVVDLINKYDKADLPESLWHYVENREGYDYLHHAEVGSDNARFVSDEIVDRFAIVGSAAAHRERLAELADAGVTQFNVYLMNGDEEEQLDRYGRRARRAESLLAELLGQRDDDPRRSPHVAEPVAVLVLGDLADELAAVCRRRATSASTSSTVNMTLRRPSVFGGAGCGSPLITAGVLNFVSSRRPCPSGVRIMVMSARTPSRPLRRSTAVPSTVASPSCSRPSSTKNEMAAARSSTTHADVVHALDRHAIEDSGVSGLLRDRRATLRHRS